MLLEATVLQLALLEANLTSPVSALASYLPFQTKIFPTFVMNQKGFHGTSFLDAVCGRKQSKGKARGVCGFVHVRRGNHLQCPETAVNHSEVWKQEWVNESTLFSSYSVEDV